MAPRETEDNAYANFWGDKQRALWYAMVFSGVVNWWVPIRLLSQLNSRLLLVKLSVVNGAQQCDC